MVNRLIDPGSELRVHRQWFLRSAMDELLEVDFAVAGKDRLYRCLDRILEHKDALCQHLASGVSLFYLFNDCRKELEAWACHTDGHWPRTYRTAAQMRQRLAQLLEDTWDPIRYTKNTDKKPRPKPKQRLHGGYSSVQRVLEGRARVVASKK